ncbi:MAG: PQQ-binding-like beta-propeller repeat protein [Planctomycetota bacterium]
MPRPQSFLAGCVFLFAIGGNASPSLAQDWSQFRGPNGNVADAKSSPVEIPQDSITWQTTIPGKGWSSPVVSEGLIWLTTAETTEATPEQIRKRTQGVQFAAIKTVAGSVKLRAICVDSESGKIVHNVVLKEITEPDLINPLNSYASPTPAISGQRVVCHFGNYGTWCLDSRSGDELWKRALEVDHSVGPGSSPIIVDNTVLIVCDGIDQQFVAGLNLETGERQWQTARPPMRATNVEYKKAYSTPLIIQIGGQQQAIIPTAQWVCAYDPSSGKEIWRADIGNGFSTTPMPVYESGFIICSTGYMSGELVAIDPKGSGDITDNISWRSRLSGPKMPTPVAKDGKLYSISDEGILSIIDIQSGEMIQRTRVGGKFASSPLVIANKLYLGNQAGEFSVFQIDGSGKASLIATNELDGAIMASPAVIGTNLIVRTSKSLMRVRP